MKVGEWRFLASIGFSFLLSAGIASGENESSSTSSFTQTRKTIETTGNGSGGGQSDTTVVGSEAVRGVSAATKFVPKFKERLKNYREQLVMGETKGWLTAAELRTFNQELDRLDELEHRVRTEGYQKAGVDLLESKVTLFNGALHKASTKQAQVVKPTTTATKPGHTIKTSKPAKLKK